MPLYDQTIFVRENNFMTLNLFIYLLRKHLRFLFFKKIYFPYSLEVKLKVRLIKIPIPILKFLYGEVCWSVYPSSASQERRVSNVLCPGSGGVYEEVR